MIFKVLLSRSVQTPNSDRKLVNFLPIANVCLQHKSTFGVHYRTGSPGHLGLRVAGFLGHWVAGSQNVTQFHVWYIPLALVASWSCLLQLLSFESQFPSVRARGQWNFTPTKFFLVVNWGNGHFENVKSPHFCSCSTDEQFGTVMHIGPQSPEPAIKLSFFYIFDKSYLEDAPLSWELTDCLNIFCSYTVTHCTVLTVKQHHVAWMSTWCCFTVKTVQCVTV